MKNGFLTLFFVLAVVFVSQLLTQGPNIIAAHNTPADKWFAGQASWFDPWDVNIYFSVIGWGKRDGWLFENLYDANPAPGIPIYTLYVLIGKIAGIFPLANYFAFHLAAVFLSFFLAIAVWKILGVFLEKRLEKLTAFSLVFLGGGLGWLLPFLPVPDVALPGFTLTKALNQPHEAASLGLFLAVVFFFYKAVFGDRRPLNLFLACLSCFFMLFFHPYNLLPLAMVFGVFGVYWWLKTGKSDFIFPVLSLGIAGGLYFLLAKEALLNNPAFSGLLAQQLPSLPPWLYLLGWGVLSPLIVLALFSKARRSEDSFVKIWFIVHFLTIYAPFGFQKLLIRGLWIPAAILAVEGVKEIASRFKLNYRPLIVPIFFLSGFSAFFMVSERLNAPFENRWIYLTKNEGEAIEFLQTNGKNEEGVLASWRLANIIPGNTAKRVFAGHSFQSPDFKERIVEVNRFLSGKMETPEAREFLRKTGVSWVFFGPDEKVIGGLEKIPYENLLEPVFEKREVVLYRVK